LSARGLTLLIFVVFAGANPDEFTVGLQPTWLYYIGPNDGLRLFPGTYSGLQMVINSLATGNAAIQPPIPQLQQDDFLFIWSFYHGHPLSLGSSTVAFVLEPDDQHPDGFMYDYDFSGLIDDVQCEKRVFWMQQRYGGGFIDDLQDNTKKNIVITASQYNEQAREANNLPVQEEEIIVYTVEGIHHQVQFFHSEFDFHMYSVANGQSPAGENSYNNALYSSADTNNDKIITHTLDKEYQDIPHIILTNQCDAFLYIADIKLDGNRVTIMIGIS